MSIWFLVRPLDDEMKEIFDQHDRPYPDVTSRMPTQEDIKKIISQFDNPNSTVSHLYVGPATIMSGSRPVIYSKRDEYCISMLDYKEEIDKGGPFMTLMGGDMDIVGPFVKELSRLCGPLVVLIDFPDGFDIIGPDTDLANLCL